MFGAFGSIFTGIEAASSIFGKVRESFNSGRTVGGFPEMPGMFGQFQKMFAPMARNTWTTGRSPTLQANGLDPKSALKFRRR